MHLTVKQERFVSEHLIDGNGTQAAIRAGYSAKSARQQASRLLTKTAIQTQIDQKRAELSQDMGITVARVVQGLLESVEEAKAKNKPMAQVNAWREIAKILGFYPPQKIEI